VSKTALYVAFAVCLPWCWAAADTALHDPMRPHTPRTTAQPDATAGGWRLTTILRSDDRDIAVLNGKALQVGDRIGDAELTAIEAWQVTLQRGDEHIVIPLARAKVRTGMIQREAKP